MRNAVAREIADLTIYLFHVARLKETPFKELLGHKDC